MLHPRSGGKVDIFCTVPDAFDRARLDRRVSTDVLGVATWVTTAEDVILSKLRWRLESRSEQQWRDCVDVAAVNELDTDYLRSWAPTLGVTDDLEELLTVSAR